VRTDTLSSQHSIVLIFPKFPTVKLRGIVFGILNPDRKFVLSLNYDLFKKQWHNNFSFELKKIHCNW
jgi:hypothetical protein